MTILAFAAAGSPAAVAQNPAPASPLALDRSGSNIEVRLNQVGFHPEAAKIAVVVGVVADDTGFELRDADGVVWRGPLSSSGVWGPSGEPARRADFSSFTTPGRYRVVVAGASPSVEFEISDDAYRRVATTVLKGFYYRRSGTELERPWAGVWARAAGHPDTEVEFHPEASSADPDRARWSAPGGWYDAADYNKYVPSAAFSVGMLLLGLEHFGPAPGFRDADIPESGDASPDLLDEALFEMRWLLAMQDKDGGVFHKLSALEFEELDTMPAEAHKTRFVFAKSTMASLHLAAVAAQTARVLEVYPQHRELARNSLTAAVSAWEWARRHPDRVFVTPEDNVTGAYTYAYETLTDDWAWAAAELYLATGDDGYLSVVDFGVLPCGVPTWDWVAPMAWLQLSLHRAELPGLPEQLASERVLVTSRRLLEAARNSAYGVAMGAYGGRFVEGLSEADFAWGSNGMAAAQGVVLLAAYRLTGEAEYAATAVANLDYLLGRNALGRSFVTGLGEDSPRHPRHRPSISDGIEEPIPGLLVGGPQAGRQDRNECKGLYPMESTPEARVYLDEACSFATNDVAINWSAPLVVLAGALDAMYGGTAETSEAHQ